MSLCVSLRVARAAACIYAPLRAPAVTTMCQQMFSFTYAYVYVPARICLTMHVSATICISLKLAASLCINLHVYACICMCPYRGENVVVD